MRTLAGFIFLTPPIREPLLQAGKGGDSLAVCFTAAAIEALVSSSNAKKRVAGMQLAEGLRIVDPFRAP